MKILITGSQGFVGHYLCEAFLNNGDTVIGVDNCKKYGDNDNRSHNTHKNFSLIRADVREEQLTSIISYFKPNIVVDAASIVGGISLIEKNNYKLMSENIDMHRCVIDACIFSNHTIDKFISISSSCIYERVADIPYLEWCLSDVPAPTNWYGFYKYCMEKYTIASGLPFTIVRLFNVAGIGDDGDYPHVITELVGKFKRGDYSICGTGDETRTFIHGKDAAAAIVMLTNKKFTTGHTFNVANPENCIRIKDLAKQIWYRIGGDITAEPLKNMNNITSFKRSEACISKLKSFGFVPHITLDYIIKEAVAYY